MSYSKEFNEVSNMSTNQKQFNDVCACLIDNGVDAGEAPIVAQALYYIMKNEETEQFFNAEC